MIPKFLSPPNNQSKKSNKKGQNQQEQIFLNSNPPNKKTNKNSNFIQDQQIVKFQSEDSEGSDISFQSSIQSEQDINIGQIQYFKEEMGRFFINYPELINNQIIQDDENDNDYWNVIQSKQNSASNKNWLENDLDQYKKQTLNKNWNLIADQILGQAKQSCSFLQALSRRIALYRSKVQQEDLIDVLLRQQKNIMKQIDLEINLKKKQIKGTKNSIENIQGSQNMYFSWRKKKQMENRLTLQKNQPSNSPTKTKNQIRQNPSGSNYSKLHRSQSFTGNKAIFNSKQKRQNQVALNNTKTRNFNENLYQNSNGNISQNRQTNSKTVYRSAEKKQTQHFTDITNNLINKTVANNKSYSIGKNGKNKQIQKQNNKKRQEDFKQDKNSQQGTCTQNFWKHLVNFQPRTQAGRQLCQLIRKTNNPNDQLGIKKTIMSFLSRTKQTVQNQIVLKSTISQKIQKLYNDDSKELLMFYPTKMSSNIGANSSNNQTNNNKDELNMQGNKYGSNLGSPTKDFIRNQQINSQEQARGGRNSGSKAANNFTTNYANMANKKIEAQSINNSKLFEEGQKFMTLLQDIVDGPLMKYWMMLQQNKL